MSAECSIDGAELWWDDSGAASYCPSCAITRITKERDTALEALREAAEWLESRPDYTEGDAAQSSRARQTIQAIETGAIHRED